MAATALLALGAVLVGWGLVEPWLLDVERETASIPHLPPSWQGREIAQISDLHVGMWLGNEATVRRAVEQIVAAGPPLAVVTGDFVSEPGPEFEDAVRRVVEILEPLGRAEIPTLAVLGNHDYNLDELEPDEPPPDEGLALTLVRALEDVGILVLRNEAVAVGLGDPGATDADPETPLYVAGIDSEWAGRAQPRAALARVPDRAPRIVILHNPDVFARLPADSAPLALAGHTHGGQVRIPYTPHWTWLTYFRSDRVHADGWISDFGAPGNRLYVNRGIGMSGLPLRVNCLPMVAWFVLQNGAAPSDESQVKKVSH